jgi:hypothetical protein
MRYLAGFLGGAVVLAAVLIINGGFVYKTTCPTPTGGHTTSWTYGIDDIVPYTRKTDPPCYSHTGTRLLLSAVRIWPLANGTAKTNPVTATDRAAAESLGTAVSAISTEYTRERKLVASLTSEARAQGVTPAVRRRFVRLLAGTVAALESIKSRVDRSPEPSDSQLVDTRDALSTYLRYQIEIDQLFSSSSSLQDWSDKVKARYGRKLFDVVGRLRFLSVPVQERFPQVKDWSFLPPK